MTIHNRIHKVMSSNAIQWLVVVERMYFFLYIAVGYCRT